MQATEKFCENCGTLFDPKSSRQKFCTSNCRVTNHRREKKWQEKEHEARERISKIAGEIAGKMAYLNNLAKRHDLHDEAEEAWVNIFHYYTEFKPE